MSYLSKAFLTLMMGAASFQALGAQHVAAAQPLQQVNRTPVAANQNVTYTKFGENQFGLTSTEKPVFTAFTASMDLGQPPLKDKAISARLSLVKQFGTNVVEFKKTPKTAFSYH